MSAVRTSRGWSLGLIALWAFSGSPMNAFAEDVERTVFADFENDDWKEQWTPVRTIEASRKTLPKEALAPDSRGDHVLVLKATGLARLETRKGLVPERLADFDAVEAWIYRAAESPEKPLPASVMEIQFLEADGATRYWRKFELTHTGWKKIRAELAFFQTSQGRLPRWEKVSRVGLLLRDSATFAVDDLAFVKSNAGGARLQADDLARLAFPDSPAGRVQTLAEEGVVLVTDRPAEDAETMIQQLVAVQKQTAIDLPFLDSPEASPALVVFSKDDDYRQFIPRLAAAFGGEGAKPRAAGFTALGIASSSWSEEYGAARPVYVHEFVHSLLSRRLDFPNHGEWLQEGLASHYQLRFHKQDDFPQIVAKQLASGRYKPLDALANGERIELTDYWQAATLCELLMESEKYRSKFPTLMNEMRRAGTTDLRLVCEKQLGVDLKTLFDDWRAFTQQKYVK